MVRHLHVGMHRNRAPRARAPERAKKTRRSSSAKEIAARSMPRSIRSIGYPPATMRARLGIGFSSRSRRSREVTKKRGLSPFFAIFCLDLSCIRIRSLLHYRPQGDSHTTPTLGMRRCRIACLGCSPRRQMNRVTVPENGKPLRISTMVICKLRNAIHADDEAASRAMVDRPNAANARAPSEDDKL